MSLLEKTGFFCDPSVAYLNTAARGLVPRAAEAACRRYFEARAGVGEGTGNLVDGVRDCKAAIGGLMGVAASDIALVGSTSDACNAVYSLVDWREGDNVVVVEDALEFPSVLIPAYALEARGVEVRAVAPEDWRVAPERIGSAVDARTRLVFVSHVSYRTGHRFDLEALGEAVRSRSGAWLAADVSQSLGVVAIPGPACDFAVSTAFKWTLGGHGAAVLYWNRTRVPDPRPVALGWHSVIDDLERPSALKPDAERFEPGSVASLPAFTLREGIAAIESVGLDAVESHVADLSGRLLEGLESLGVAVITPRNPALRAGITCWQDPGCGQTAASLAERGVVVTGSAGRVRASVHLYNDAQDVDRLLQALRA